MGRMTGKVALITGAARGQGRSHALALAREGADVIALDLCEDIATNEYPLAGEEDLAETARQVEAYGRRVVAATADVRDARRLDEVIAEGVAGLGRLDVVVANAGICPLGGHLPLQAWVDAVDVDLVGVVNTVHAALPHMTEGGSVVCTGSLAAFMENGTDNPTAGPGGLGYSWAKRMVADFVHHAALAAAPFGIRINAVHPTNCNTDMLNSDPMYRQFCPDKEQPTREQALRRFPAVTAMGVPYVEPSDVSNAVLFLASDEARYVTGLQFRVDAGGYLRFNRFQG